MATFLRVALSFAAVGGLLWLFARAGRGRLGALLAGTVGKPSSDPLVVLERRQLTKSSGVALLRVGRRHLLVGVGDDSVQLLAEGDDLLVEQSLDGPGEAETAKRRHGSGVDAPGDHERFPIELPEHDDSSRPIALADVELGAAMHAPSDGAAPSDLQRARTRLPRAVRPDPPRTSFVDALREMTVRRS